MSLSETTRKILRLVEARSGISVHVAPDPDLPGTALAKVVMARAHQATCISNLKQTGLAVQMFADDHNDVLPPGPGVIYRLYFGQRPGCFEVTRWKYELAYYIATYLALPAPSTMQTNIAKVFFCPAFERFEPPIRETMDERTCYGLYSPAYSTNLNFRSFGCAPNQPTPVHGHTRNYLFVDQHVAARRAGPRGTY